MEQYVVEGGNPLVGEVEIGGAKNAALAILAASVMTDETVLIENMPDVRDTNILLQAMQSIGVIVDRVDPHTVKVNASHIHDLVIEDDFIKKIRASYYLLGALLGKYNKAEVALPGGCNIGSRPIDQHLKGFAALGAEIEDRGGMVYANAEHLLGGDVFFDMVTVGGTINVMLAAARAEGTTVIYNAAKEPHIVDLANFLNSMGARVKGAGTDVIRIRGMQHLHHCTYTVIPDQIETGTLMIAAAATRGDVTIHGCIPTHMEALTAKLLEMGVRVTENDDSIRVRPQGEQRAVNVKTQVYPGFPTDLQQPMTALLCMAHGTSTVCETIFEQRFKHLDELRRMGAHIKLVDRTVLIEGVRELYGAPVTVTDLRAGAALVVAGLMAKGVTEIYETSYIDRGYERIEEKLRALGAEIRREKI